MLSWSRATTIAFVYKRAIVDRVYQSHGETSKKEKGFCKDFLCSFLWLDGKAAIAMQ